MKPSKKDNTHPAHPCNTENYGEQPGMTIRQAFIMAAMQGLCANPDMIKPGQFITANESQARDIAIQAECIADQCLGVANA